MNRLFTLLLVGCFSYYSLSAQENSVDNPHQIDLSPLFTGVEGCFVLYDLNADVWQMYQPDQCQQRFSPCSTFKIPHSLIALETGVADGVQFTLPWDSLRTPAQAWMQEREPFKHWLQDHTMQSALKYSVVWYYQELARRIGADRMNHYLQLMAYGNRDASSGIDRFWLCGSLRLSAIEQVNFLKKFYTYALPGFSVANMEVVKTMLLYESTDGYQLYGKTGGGDCMPGKVIGWYVGFVETESHTYLFAMNMLAAAFSDFDNNRRIELTKSVLMQLGVIPYSIEK